jgi:Photosynthesis system II assembly factor YCF48/Putative zinc-finger
MAELPEIVRQRMARQVGGDHPDPDLLTAFAEGALGERERTPVLAHLGACAACREVVSLALPEALDSSAVPAAPQSRWLRWPVLRWGGVAAAVVVVAAAVMFRETRRVPVMNVGGAVSETKHEETEPAKVAEPQLRDEQTRTEAKDKALAKKQDNAGAKAKSSTSIVAGRRDTSLATSEAPNEAAVGGARKAQPAATAMGGVQANAAMSQMQQQRVPTAPQQSQQQVADAERQAYQAGAASDKLQQQPQLSMAQQDAPAGRAPRAAPASPPPMRAKQAQQGAQQTQQNIVAADSAEAVASVPTASTVPATVANGAVMMKSSVMRTSPARWRVSSEGNVEQSLDAGGSWRVVPVRGEASFRAISAVGSDIWAGGVAGALYHSTDGGQNWTRVFPRWRDVVLTADIARVEFTDGSKGAVTTASGESWVTADGGRTWTARRR